MATKIRECGALDAENIESCILPAGHAGGHASPWGPIEATPATAARVGGYIGRGMARDVIAEGMPRGWTGFDAQDADRIPAGLDYDEVEAEARKAYEAEIKAAG
jgi:hypothetical protein